MAEPTLHLYSPRTDENANISDFDLAGVTGAVEDYVVDSHFRQMSEEEAAIKIQSFFRSQHTRKSFRLLLKSIFVLVKDETTGYSYYFNKKVIL
jgi:hypothetical protein